MTLQKKLDSILQKKSQGIISTNDMVKAIKKAGMTPVTYRQYLCIHYVKAKYKGLILESTITINKEQK